MFKVFVVWGGRSTVAEEGDRAIRTYQFATLVERDAFLLGVTEAEGWMDAYTADTYEEAQAHVTECQE